VSKFGKHKWWIITGILTLPVLALGQSAALYMFSPGTVISSAQVNSNFSVLSARLAAVEKTLSGASIPDIVNPALATNAAYMAATAVRLPIYKVTPGESGGNETGASCNTGDVLIGGGCNGRDALGTETCMVERNYPISSVAWYCRSRKANGMHTECRATAFAVCLKSY
jgi:hypothetical protein